MGNLHVRRSQIQVRAHLLHYHMKIAGLWNDGNASFVLDMKMTGSADGRMRKKLLGCSAYLPQKIEISNGIENVVSTRQQCDYTENISASLVLLRFFSGEQIVSHVSVSGFQISTMSRIVPRTCQHTKISLHNNISVFRTQTFLIT